MDFLPDGRFLLTERGDVPTQGPGDLKLVTTAGAAIDVTGLPANTGLFDVKIAPDFATSRLVYVSFFEPAGPGEPRRGRNAGNLSLQAEGLSVFRATLSNSAAAPTLSNVSVIWRQEKLVPIGLNNQQGGYLAFSPDGRYLYITAGCRDEFDDIQDNGNEIAKIVRIFPDGSIPSDNPFVGVAGARGDIWSRGHRNPYGLAFDQTGQLWEHENGPMGGDEFNLIVAGANYGWPIASNGRSYGATVDDIPDHKPGDGFAAPAYTWYDSVAPSGLIFYHGSQFAAWEGDAVLGALKGQELIRMKITGTTAAIAQEIHFDARIRAVREAPDGAIWVVEDAPSGKVVKLTAVLAP
jgi:glucose/arabinose dehydrogenase